MMQSSLLFLTAVYFQKQQWLGVRELSAMTEQEEQLNRFTCKRANGIRGFSVT